MGKNRKLFDYIYNNLKNLLHINERELKSEILLILEHTDNLKEIDSIIKRRLKREPIQYILGKAYFYNLELKIGKGVLIPRFDTEVLVEKTIEHIHNLQKTKKNIRILDICCGSGAIGLSILNNTNNTEVLFSDISKDALNYAKDNAKTLKLESRSKFLISDMFKEFNESDKFDIMVCNPPYITEEEYKKLDKELTYEPSLALVSEYDKFYEILAKEAFLYINATGVLFTEINSNYSKELQNIFKKKKIKVKVYKDYNTLDRFFIIKEDS